MYDMFLAVYTLCLNCKYHNTIDGQIVTAVVVVVFASFAIYVALENFVFHKDTSADFQSTR